MTTVMLDCESVESTYASVAEVIGVPIARLRHVLRALEPPESDESLAGRIRERLGGFNVSAFRTSWFHLTRAPESADFSQGLLPLGACLDTIWKYLESLADGNAGIDFANFRRVLEAQRGSHYASKALNASHWGPYGVLVRDTPFRSDFGSGHFFEAPEIVVDICNPFREQYQMDLLEHFVKNTKPCIVKFWHHAQNPKALSSALYYLYCMEHGDSLGFCALLDFDGQGVTVPPDRILNVEFPEVLDRPRAA